MLTSRAHDEIRAKLSGVIRRRARVTPTVAILLALGFALLITPIVLLDGWLLDPRVEAGARAEVTVRVPAFEGWDDERVDAGGGSVVIARGEVATARQAAVIAAMVDTAPPVSARFAAYGAILFLLAAGVTHQMRRSNRGRLLRVQMCLLGTVALGAVVTKGLLLLYPVSVLAVPVALGAMVPTLVFDRTVGLAAGVLSAVTMGLLVPFDVGVSTVLVVQAVVAAIVLPDRARPRWPVALGAGAVAMVGAGLTYLGFHYLSDGVVPTSELSDPGRSAWLAAAFGGAVAGVLAMPLLPVFEAACGEITHGRLVALEDMSHPVLKQIADKAPGTWQHSLAMANLAEVAAHAIGANGRLVRVGAYFHDVGKSLQPNYFIENLRAGESSPHDHIAPEVSCDAIFAHVTEGIAFARRAGVPERIIDFMHMHHGDGVLEYFWAKCQEQGNPRRLTIDDFRYPGVRPQSRETAILAICDAVEAASRTLKRPDDRAVESLVQRIVYGKLHLGQLDESGLSMADLRQISDSLREAIRAAHHGRIEYPWQREAAAAAAAAAEPATVALGAAARVASATQRMMSEPRLDSLDAPRPMQWEDTRPRTTAQGTAPTQPMVSPLPLSETTPLPLAPIAIDTVSMRPSEPSASASAPAAPPMEAGAGPIAAAPPAAPARPAKLPWEIDAPAAPPADASSSWPEITVSPASTSQLIAAMSSSQPLPVSASQPLPAVSASQPLPAVSAFAQVLTPSAADVVRPQRPAPALIVAEPALSIATARTVPPGTGPTPQLFAPPTMPPVASMVEDAGPRPITERVTERILAVPPPTPASVAAAVPGAEPVTGSEPGSGSGSGSVSEPGSGSEPGTGSEPGAVPDAGAVPGSVSGPATVPVSATDGEPLVARLARAGSEFDAVVDTLPGPGPARGAVSAVELEAPRSNWANALASRLDAMLDADEEAAEEAFAATPTLRTPPPPPPARRPRITNEVAAEDIEATIDLSPQARAEPGGAVTGPPPATRPVRTMPLPAEAEPDVGEDGPTVVRPRPSGSMLPPRSRTKSD